MIAYAGNTGTRRNLDALAAAGWRIILTPHKRRSPPAGFRYALDNGAWSAYQQGHPLDLVAFADAVDRLGAQADWVVAPDIVAGGERSLDLSASWLPRLRQLPLVLIAVQDGMTPAMLAPLVGPRVGIFLGGSTDWKLATMPVWGAFASARGLYFHVARVNTRRRIRLAHWAGASSIDGTSATRYAVTLPMLDDARRQANLFVQAVA